MRLKELRHIFPLIGKTEYDNIHIDEVMVHSGEPAENSIFFVHESKKMGLYVEQAFQNGAVIALSDSVINKPGVIYYSRLEQHKNLITKAIYDYPDEKLDIIGVTGTNGKTSITFMLTEILRNIGMRCARTGTVNVDLCGKTYAGINTFPEGPRYLKYVAEAGNNGAQCVVSEVSSHALALGRTDDIDINIGVFTNLTRDHLDFHGDMRNYYNAKRRLFEIVAGSGSGRRGAVICNDCEYGEHLIREFQDVIPVITYGKDKGSDLCLLGMENTSAGARIRVMIAGEKKEFNIPYMGDYNALNILACLGVCTLMGISDRAFFHINENMSQIPGRLQKISKNGLDVFIDYSHTPDSLRKAITALSQIYGKVVTVFGCGGDRDKGKRPLMGRISAECSFHSFITDDNPRNESSEDIIHDIIIEMDRDSFTVISDRKKAIREAAVMARKEHAALLVAGKGHEEYQDISGRKIYFSDAGIVRDL